MKSPFHNRKDGKEVASSAAMKMKTVIQVMSHGTSDCQAPAIILQTVDGQRHLFGGISEGFQRIMTQNKIKMSKMNNIFLTGQLNWSSIGGLPGLLLTISDQGVNSIRVHSATKNLSWACAVWRHFIFRQGLELRPIDMTLPEFSIHEDKFFSVAGIPIISSTADPVKFGPDQKEIDELAKDFVKIMFPKDFTRSALQQKKGPPTPRSPPPERITFKVNVSSKLTALPNRDTRSTCYIIQIKPTRGKFQVQKAKDLGVPPGALFSKLTKGESVQTPDGTIVTPDQVLAPPVKGPRVLVIDCPSEDFVDSVISQDWLQSLYKSEAASLSSECIQDEINSPVRKRQRTDGVTVDEGFAEKPSVVYHMLGKSVNPFSGPYFEWLKSTMDTFSPECLHFITHPDYAPDGISFDAAALLNIQLRYLYPDNFRTPYTANPTLDISEQTATPGFKVHPMITLGTVGLEPAIAYDSSQEKGNGEVSWIDVEAEVLEPLKVKLEAASLSLKPDETDPDIVEDHLKDVEVITLGTGSALPSKYRNVVSTLVRVKPGSRKSIMLDCGEATMGNMRRMYGPKMAEEIVKEIRILYLSHLHADHHLGALSVIKEWLRVTDPATDRLYVMGPWKYFLFLSEWSQLEPAVDMGRLRFVDNESYMRGHSYLLGVPHNEPAITLSEAERSEATEVPSWFQEMATDVGLTHVRTCKARHCDLAYCVSFTFAMDGGEDKQFQVSYSGDTRPTNVFAYRVGRNSDLLIHEATHENGLEGEAAKKKHSTIGQALEIARKMEAKYTVLTHFSQRYPKLPDIESTKESRPEQEQEKEQEAEVPSLLNEPETIEKDTSSMEDQELNPAEGVFELKVALAFDGLQLKLKDIAQQKLKYEQLKLVFAEVEQEEVAISEQEDKELIKDKQKSRK